MDHAAEHTRLKSMFGSSLNVIADCHRKGSRILSSADIVDLIELPSVPRNKLPVKGFLSTAGAEIPLVDLSCEMSAGDCRKSRPASAIIVDIDGTELGLILTPAAA
ncbi:MAG: hypothetical protein ACLFVU_04425 [Phycisphaerae bacterium]